MKNQTFRRCLSAFEFCPDICHGGDVVFKHVLWNVCDISDSVAQTQRSLGELYQELQLKRAGAQT